MCETIPKDPAMLLSYVNLKLRDYYKSLDEMCADLALDKADLEKKLAVIDYSYDERTNQFT